MASNCTAAITPPPPLALLFLYYEHELWTLCPSGEEGEQESEKNLMMVERMSGRAASESCGQRLGVELSGADAEMGGSEDREGGGIAPGMIG